MALGLTDSFATISFCVAISKPAFTTIHFGVGITLTLLQGMVVLIIAFATVYENHYNYCGNNFTLITMQIYSLRYILLIETNKI